MQCELCKADRSQCPGHVLTEDGWIKRAPAATGSGEPNPYGLKVELELVPTPPASQPSQVTLDRETFDKARLRLTHLRHLLSPTAHIDGGKFDLAVEVLALLRAAEQK